MYIWPLAVFLSPLWTGMPKRESESLGYLTNDVLDIAQTIWFQMHLPRAGGLFGPLWESKKLAEDVRVDTRVDIRAA